MIGAVFAILELAMWYFLPVVPVAKLIAGILVCGAFAGWKGTLLMIIYALFITAAYQLFWKEPKDAGDETVKKD